MARFFTRQGGALALLLVCAAIIGLTKTAQGQAAQESQGHWQSLETGLDLGEFTAPRPSPHGNSRITVLRIDTARFSLGLYSANALKLPNTPTINGWMREEKLVAAINAGMFERDGSTTGYSRIGTQEPQPSWKNDYGAVFAFDPDDSSLPAATILDGDCEDVRSTEKRYRVVLQSMRMIGCKGANHWKPSGRIWSTAALGIDDKGRVLFIMARSPWDVHDFIENLKALPIGIVRAMYLEGGPEVSLAVNAGGVSFVRLGSWESRFNENEANDKPWELPNVIGVRRK